MWILQGDSQAIIGAFEFWISTVKVPTLKLWSCFKSAPSSESNSSFFQPTVFVYLTQLCSHDLTRLLLLLLKDTSWRVPLSARPAGGIWSKLKVIFVLPVMFRVNRLWFNKRSDPRYKSTFLTFGAFIQPRVAQKEKVLTKHGNFSRAPICELGAAVVLSPGANWLT